MGAYIDSVYESLMYFSGTVTWERVNLIVFHYVIHCLFTEKYDYLCTFIDKGISLY